MLKFYKKPPQEVIDTSCGGFLRQIDQVDSVRGLSRFMMFAETVFI
jgi:hypothetical protein